MILLYGQVSGLSELDHEENIHMVTLCCGNRYSNSATKLDLYVTYEQIHNKALLLKENIWNEKLIKTMWPSYLCLDLPL